MNDSMTYSDVAPPPSSDINDTQSVSGAAEDHPPTTPFVTSGSQPINQDENPVVVQTSDGVGGDELVVTLAENLPDVPEAAIACPSACLASPDQGVGAEGEGQPPPADPAEGDPSAGGDGGVNRWVVTGSVQIGVMTAPRETFAVHQNPDLRVLLEQTGLPADTVVEIGDKTAVRIVDVDTHDWPKPPGRAELLAYLADIRPVPDASWISHGHGLKLVYIGPDADDRSLAAAFKVPKCFSVELLSHTRHPGATSSQHPSAQCEALTFADNPGGQFTFRAVGRINSEQRAQVLADLDLKDGERYDHDRCPIAPNTASDAKACVKVLEGGVYCYRCASRGVTHVAGAKPGYWPFTAAGGSPTTHLDRLAEFRIHWTHARLVLIHHYPKLGETILRMGYERSLEARYGGDDPRITKVFNADLDIVWSEAGWLDASNYHPTKVDNDIANQLPYILNAIPHSDGTKQTKIDTARRSQVKNRKANGYTPVRPYRGITFEEADGVIPVRTDSDREHPVELLSEPLPEAEAWELLVPAFPKLDHTYLKACLAAAICGEACRGRPPMLVCTGPAGSAKEQTIRLAASFLGDEICKLPLTQDEEKFARSLGAALAAGHRFIVFDELTKTPRLAEKVKQLLAISARVTWRPLFANGTVDTPFRAAVFFPVTYFPEFLSGSPELNRRVWHIHLYHKVPDWQQSSGGDTSEWRDRSAENARVANSILTHIWSNYIAR